MCLNAVGAIRPRASLADYLGGQRTGRPDVRDSMSACPVGAGPVRKRQADLMAIALRENIGSCNDFTRKRAA